MGTLAYGQWLSPNANRAYHSSFIYQLLLFVSFFSLFLVSSICFRLLCSMPLSSSLLSSLSYSNLQVVEQWKGHVVRDSLTDSQTHSRSHCRRDSMSRSLSHDSLAQWLTHPSTATVHLFTHSLTLYPLNHSPTPPLLIHSHLLQLITNSFTRTHWFPTHSLIHVSTHSLSLIQSLIN